MLRSAVALSMLFTLFLIHSSQATEQDIARQNQLDITKTTSLRTAHLPPNEKSENLNIVFLGDSTVRYLFIGMVLLLRKRKIDWNCENECCFNEHTFKDWPTFYNWSTKNDFWCDCVRVVCCRRTSENWYATTPYGSFSYLQVYLDQEIRGRWLPGQPDSERLPRHKSKYEWSWSYHMSDFHKVVPGPIDTIVWNIGFHECLNATTLQAIHEQLERRAKRVIFLRTLGWKPCITTPLRSEIFDDYPVADPTIFWDTHSHLKGPISHFVATRLLSVLVPSFKEEGNPIFMHNYNEPIQGKKKKAVETPTLIGKKKKAVETPTLMHNDSRSIHRNKK